MKKGLCIIFVFLNFSLLSQTKDSVYTNLFSNVSQYRDYSEVYLGNFGLAKFNLLSPFKENENKLKTLFPTNNKSKLYTDIFFLTGSGKENYLNVEYHQNLNENLKMELFLTKTSSIGNYQVQETSLSDYNFILDYSPKEKKYSFKIDLDYYRRYNELNGGINDTIFNGFLDSNITLKTLYPIQFTSGFSLNKHVSKEINYNFSHLYKLTDKPNDTTGYFSLNQSIGYEKESFKFNSENTYFFDSVIHLDTLETVDSLREIHLTHRLSLSYKKLKQNVSLGIFTDYVEYNSYSPFITQFKNTLFGTYKNKFDKINYESKIGVTFEKDNFYSYHFTNLLDYSNPENKVFQQINAEINIYSERYDLFFENYKSNHYMWSRSSKLNNILALKFNATSEKMKFKTGFDFQNHDNAILFDSSSNLIQTKISFISFNLQKHFDITSWLKWDVNLHFQDMISKESIESPNLVSSNRLYFQGKILKNNILKFKLGFNVLYYSSFYAKAYNPALDKFYLQNHTKVGNYPFIDFFAEFYLKNNFAFFASITHFNSGLTGNNYLATTNYPSQDRAFKFGLKWRLFE